VDLVICDVVMPEFDGFKFLIYKAARPEFSEIPVIMLTSLEEVNQKIKGLEQGASDYVTKPFDEGELMARVKVHLKIKYLQDELRQKNAQLRELSGTDELTRSITAGVLWSTHQGILAGRAVQARLSFVIFDIDYFKQINDRMGHLIGDRVLVQVTQ